MKSLPDDQHTHKEPQCLKCQHYLQNCGTCVSTHHGAEELKKFINSETIESNIGVNESENEKKKIDLDSYKYSCKVVMNSPEDFNVVNPFNCKYYFPNAFKLY